MPAFPSLFSLPAAQLDQNLTTAIIQQSNVPNSTSNTVQVICAWPVSGQYGPGSRFLYVAQYTQDLHEPVVQCSKFDNEDCEHG